MNQSLDLSAADLFEMVKDLIEADDRHGDGIIGGSELARRALVVVQNQTKLVWAQQHDRRVGIPEIDRLLADPIGSIGHMVKSEAANLYAAAAELGTAVDAGGEPVGVIGFTYNESRFVSAFHYPLDKYENDADIEALLVDQENILRAEQQAADLRYEQAHGGLEPNPTEAEEERDALRFLDEQKLEPVWNDITQPLASETELEKNYRDKDGGGW